MEHTPKSPVRIALFDPADGEDRVLACDCTFKAINGQVRFTYCSLHYAAPALLETLEKHLPESLGHRADGEKECHYCHRLVSLDPHAPECPRAAVNSAKGAS